ncbi:involucrin [Pleuronectes platessa]|uniref:involucrin n=1 Tax=Pleuronectes platessa TaxID=8262 RepID=UPI00232A0C6A|nr:involucrin [Pleuronectes platessa]
MANISKHIEKARQQQQEILDELITACTQHQKETPPEMETVGLQLQQETPPEFEIGCIRLQQGITPEFETVNKQQQQETPAEGETVGSQQQEEIQTELETPCKICQVVKDQLQTDITLLELKVNELLAKDNIYTEQEKELHEMHCQRNEIQLMKLDFEQTRMQATISVSNTGFSAIAEISKHLPELKTAFTQQQKENPAEWKTACRVCQDEKHTVQSSIILLLLALNNLFPEENVYTEQEKELHEMNWQRDEMQLMKLGRQKQSLQIRVRTLKKKDLDMANISKHIEKAREQQQEIPAELITACTQHQKETPPEMETVGSQLQQEPPPELEIGCIHLQQGIPPEFETVNSQLQQEIPPEFEIGCIRLQQGITPEFETVNKQQQQETPPELEIGCIRLQQGITPEFETVNSQLQQETPPELEDSCIQQQQETPASESWGSFVKRGLKIAVPVAITAGVLIAVTIMVTKLWS